MSIVCQVTIFHRPYVGHELQPVLEVHGRAFEIAAGDALTDTFGTAGKGRASLDWAGGAAAGAASIAAMTDIQDGFTIGL